MVKKKDNFVIPRKAMLGVAPAIAISAILISRHGPGELLLFWVGVSVGIFIMKGWKK